MRWRRRTACLAGSLMLACAAAEPPVADWVREAVSAEDHQKIAQYYRKAAQESRKKAEGHRDLARVYGSEAMMGIAFRQDGRDHCTMLSAREEGLAAQYELLAVEHERVAEAVSRESVDSGLQNR